MSGQLFTRYYLTEGIKATTRWNSSAANAEAFRDGVQRSYDALRAHRNPNEAVTEQELIRPVLELLGWTDYLPQQGAARNEDIPDLLLFADSDSKTRAAGNNPNLRYADALVVEESKRFGLPLDARDEDDVVRARTPHGQILRYLSTAESAADGGARWGILTNGGVWRLYDRRARPRATGYFEVDLADALQRDAQDELRTFNLLFRRDSFVKRAGATETFLERALEEGRRYERRVAQDLSRVVFERAFPSLAQALAEAGGRDLAQVRQAALVLLYRLLFVLYAEDRGLLPVNDTGYDDYGLRKRVRDDVADRTARGDTFSKFASSYYDHVMTLCKIIDRGDASIGLPPYNGGLFAAEAAPLLEAVRLPDAAFAPIIHDLSHTETDGERRFVSYRDMSVQQLGSIYERLLEREPVFGDGGKIVIRPNPYARKDSGSFYTPQELVDLIVGRHAQAACRRAPGTAFERKSDELKSDRRPKSRTQGRAAQTGPGRGGARSQGARPGDGQRPLPGHGGRLSVRRHRRPGRVRAGGPRVARRRVRVAARGPHSVDPRRNPAPGQGIELDSGRGPAHRPGHHPPHGAQALHLRRGQEPAHRRAGQGLAVAAQLHRRCAAIVSGPPPAPRRLADRAAGDRRPRRPAQARRAAHGNERRRRCRYGRGRNAAYRGDVRRRRGRGARVGRAVSERRGDHRRPARRARLPLRPALAYRRDEEARPHGPRGDASARTSASSRRCRLSRCSPADPTPSTRHLPP